MQKVLDVNKIYEINQLLAKKQINYTLHTFGGCGSCGVELRTQGKEIPVEDLCAIINEYLKDKWMRVEPIKPHAYVLKVL